MSKRFISIWFRHLRTDWYARRQPEYKEIPFILATADHGRMLISAVNIAAEKEGLYIGMVVADARAIVPALQVIDDRPELSNKLLKGIAEWCIRFTPIVGIDGDNGLLMDVSGCSHLWGSEKDYMADIYRRLRQFEYDVTLAIADTIGAAWAIARFGSGSKIIARGQQKASLLHLPPSCLRLDFATSERLEKLGLRQVKNFIDLPRPSLRRRFGEDILLRLDQAVGTQEEWVCPVNPIEPYHERLPCIEPIVTRTGIEIGLTRLLEDLCHRLQLDQKGLRTAALRCYRLDGKIEQIEIGTNRPTTNSTHLFKLFEIKLDSIEPALGIELFTLDASKVESLSTVQENLWEINSGLNNVELAELLDRIGGKIGSNLIHRYIPDQHYWPERSFKIANSINDKPAAAWKSGRPRPIQLLSIPQPIEVTAPIPDYPPMMFRYKGQLHKIVKADGPERIEQEWWLQDGQHRDYYYVENEEGKRYWLFRSGHYDTAKSYQWFLHGFFA